MYRPTKMGATADGLKLQFWVAQGDRVLLCLAAEVFGLVGDLRRYLECQSAESLVSRE